MDAVASPGYAEISSFRDPFRKPPALSLGIENRFAGLGDDVWIFHAIIIHNVRRPAT